jgi:hypothetical protein
VRRSHRLQINHHGAAYQRFRLRQSVSGGEQRREGYEVCRHVRMIGAQARLVDRDRAALQRLRLRQIVGDTEQISGIGLRSDLLVVIIVFT